MSKIQRRLNADDFKLTAVPGKQSNEGGMWAVADRYEIQDDEIIARPRFEDGYARWWGYRPLEDTPDLFLKFARLHDQPDFEVGVLEWCSWYGLPGGSGPAKNRRPPDIWTSEIARSMPVSVLQEEVDAAWHILTIYEAVLNRDEETAIAALAPDDLAYLRSSSVGAGDLGRRALQRCLHHASWRVSLMIHDYCAPRLIQTEPETLTVKSQWNFYNLLGAMYIQMYWLMASGEDVARCVYCGQILSLARPHPESRKRRRDKKFCDDACRQAHHRAKKKS